MSFIPSKYQKAIFDWIIKGIGNTLISACAGSGKTFTIVKALEYVTGDVLFLAFNKSIANELKDKLAKSPLPEGVNVNASTLNSFGNSILYAKYGAMSVVPYFKKYGAIMDQIGLLEQKSWSWNEKKNNREKRDQVLALVKLVKDNLLDINDNQAIADAAEHMGIQYDSQALDIMRQVMLKAASLTNTIVFDDQIYVPVVRKLDIPQYDWVLIDETQDLNPCQIELVLRVVKKGGRVIAVGDRQQSIYGFRGADVDAMDKVSKALKATELPLSVCYRCPVSHVNLAKQIVPQIESAPNAKEGIIETVTDKMFQPETLKNVTEKTMVLCRTNAPLTSFALRLLSSGIKCSIKGRDIGSGLVKLVRKLDGFSISQILDSLDVWEEKEIDKEMKREKPCESTMELIRDKANCIRAIAQDCDSKQCILDKLEILFSDEDSNGIQLSSVHRAKGLEAETVYIIRPELLPLKRKNQKAWELEQERNIQYVAYTRSKNKLVFVTTTR